MGLHKEFANGLNMMHSILTEWKEKNLDSREIYHLFYKKLMGFNKHIARRYDYMTGSKYLFIVAEQLHEGLISLEDMKELSEEAIRKITFLSGS